MTFNFAKSDRVLITGGTGTLGQALIPLLLSQCKVRVMSRDECKQGELKKQWPEVEWMLGDVRDYHACRNAVRGADAVIHAAALKYVDLSEQQPSEYVQTNVVGTMNLINAVIDDGGVRHMVGISTDKAAAPFNCYGLTKGLLEKLFIEAHAFKRKSIPTNFNVCRYGNVIGSRGSVVLKWQELARAKQRIKVTDPSMTRFFFTVDDAVNLIVEALLKSSGVIVSRAMPATTLGELAALWGEYDIMGPRPGEKKHEDLLTEHEMPRVVQATCWTSTERDLFVYDPLASPQDLHRALGPMLWDGPYEHGYTSANARRLTHEELKTLTEEWRS